ncbi:hypothetical protein TNCV_3885161 [Trichonephila clavipes]|nr:hypothetical protein TNCV_3885161 [Trichonephila clavipes]
MRPKISIKCNRLSHEMAPHTTGEGGMPLYCEGRVEKLTTRHPHTYTIIILPPIESGFVAEDGLIPFGCLSELTYL